MKGAILLLVLGSFSEWIWQVKGTSTIVKLPLLGELEGFASKTFHGRTYYSFIGVPYARPPIGKYRFKEPQPVKPWSGTLKANTTYKCMQYCQFKQPGQDDVLGVKKVPDGTAHPIKLRGLLRQDHFILGFCHCASCVEISPSKVALYLKTLFLVSGDEDCLYLNIYTPNLDENANLDVIFYFHGGAFMYHYGAGQNADFLLDKNVVYVNINYRLGPLGFLSTEDDVVPGNNGIKDQIMALRWVHDNIKYFGGNPESVTTVGCSAGGASVHFHYLTKKSRGLFHRGISQSGTALNPWVIMEEPLETTKKLSEYIGCPTNDVEKMVQCLRRRSARQVVNAVKVLQPWLYNPFSPFGVVVDTWSSDPVLTDHPFNLLLRGEVADLPWIISYTNSEGLYPGFEFYDDQYLQEIDSEWNDIIPFILHYNSTVHPGARDWISQKIRKFYLGDKKVSKETFMDFIHILSDRLFVADIDKAGRLQAATTKSPVYAYQFTYRGARSMFDFTYGADNDLGASHADDTGYIFKTNMNTRSTETDAKMGEVFLTMIESFAQSGEPKLGVQWPPLSRKIADPFVYLKIASPHSLVVETQGSVGNRTFWDNLPLNENEKFFKGKDEL